MGPVSYWGGTEVDLVRGLVFGVQSHWNNEFLVFWINTFLLLVSSAHA